MNDTWCNNLCVLVNGKFRHWIDYSEMYFSIGNFQPVKYAGTVLFSAMTSEVIFDSYWAMNSRPLRHHRKELILWHLATLYGYCIPYTVA